MVERHRTPTESEMANFQSDWKRVFGLLEYRNAPLRDLERARSVFDRLEFYRKAIRIPVPEIEAESGRAIVPWALRR